MGRFTEVLEQSFRSGASPDTLHTGALATIGSVAITNASIDVNVTVADYVTVTPSGTFYAAQSGLNTYRVTPSGTWFSTVSPSGNSVWGVSGLVYQGTTPWTVSGQVSVNSYLGSTFYLSGTQDVSGIVSVTQNTIPWSVSGQVNQGTSPWVISGMTNSQVYASGIGLITTPYPNAPYYYLGMHMAISGAAAATNFSGVANATEARKLLNVTVYGGLDNDDFVDVRLSGLALTEAYLSSGVWTEADSSHSFDFDNPWSWTSGAELRVFVDNNTAKDRSVNAVIKYTT